jgi:membrane protease YdiL (CAAX protease family)
MFLKNAEKGSNHWWAYLLTVTGVIAGFAFGQIPLSLVILSNNQEMNEDRLMELMQKSDFEALGMEPNYSLFLILLSFVGAFLMLWLLLKNLHKRSIKTLITPFEKINWGKALFGFGLWMLFALIIEGVTYLIIPEAYIFQLEWSKFIPLLLICILILPIQTTFEEIFFRGYLMQGIGLISRYKWIPLVITSVLFGSMHFFNPEVEKFGAGLMLTYYIGVGLFLGFITLMDDSLELALGIHAATNFFSATFVTFEGSALKTNAIFLTEVVNIELMLLLFFASAALFIFICWRKYNWTTRNQAFGKIEKNIDITT